MKGGTADAVGPWRWETTAPSSGQPPRGRFSFSRPVRRWAATPKRTLDAQAYGTLL
jgi:hypothetical protein